LGSDRGAKLVVRAATRGIIDFSKARFYDPSWWLYLASIFDELEDEIDRDIERLLFQHQLALLSSGSLSSADFKLLQAGARKTFEDLSQSLQPWLRDLIEKTRQTEQNSLVEIYRREIGDMRDPEFNKKIMDEVKRLREMDKGRQVGTINVIADAYQRAKQAQELKEKRQQDARDRKKRKVP